MTKIQIDINPIVNKNLNDMGISPSKLGKVLVDSWYHQPLNNVTLLCNTILLKEKIDQLKSEIETLKAKEELLVKFEKEFEIQQMLLDQSREASTAFEELQYLNKRIVFYNYVEDEILLKHGDVVESISNYDPEFNLKNHIKRLKDLNSIL